MSSYSGWRDVMIVWLDGKTEKIDVVGYDPARVVNGVLQLRVSERGAFRFIPLTSIREWRMTEY